MDLFSFARRLIDVESITGNEAAVGELLAKELSGLGFEVHRMPLPDEPARFNLVAVPRDNRHPPVVFSTHIDTVPPFFPSREDGERIYGRGACDTKGIIATQVAASLKLREQGVATGLLFVVGEETSAVGAKLANEHPIGSRFLINGEPTDNRLGIASKGTLRVEITCTGKMAHSAYPHLGESAIEKLLDSLERVRAIPLPVHEKFGACTVNIGVIEAGRAANVIPDRAYALLFCRLIGSSGELRRQMVEAVGQWGEVVFAHETPFVELRSIEGLPTMMAAFATDIPWLGNWGQPLLLGPGSVHLAHTEDEHIRKSEMLEAVELYCDVVQKLLA